MAKKVTKKKIEVRTSLTEVEMVKFDLNNEANKRRKLEIENLNLKKEVMRLNNIISQKDIATIDRILKDVLVEHNKEKVSHKEFYDTLCNELCLSSGFGYNPDTGEIVK